MLGLFRHDVSIQFWIPRCLQIANAMFIDKHFKGSSLLKMSQMSFEKLGILVLCFFVEFLDAQVQWSIQKSHNVRQEFHQFQ